MGKIFLKVEQMQTTTILAVDDEPFNLDLIELTFMDAPDIELIRAVHGRDALEKLQQIKPYVILLDLRMPVMDGLELLGILKSDALLAKIPVIVITANSEEKNRALELGANDFLAKPVDTRELKLRAFNAVMLYKNQMELEKLNASLDDAVKQRTLELQKALEFAQDTEYEISLRLGLASEYRDLETGMHIKRISHFSALLGKLAKMNDDETQLLLYSSPLHDIGKIGIPDAILLKPGKLEEREFEVMKEHTTIGGKMLDDGDKYPIIKAGQIIATQHHEKYDGTGYPNGLKGEEIHIYARIVAIVDVFDALTSKRVYKDPFPIEVALKIMQEGRGTHFDPIFLDLFVDNISKFLEIKENFIDSDETPHIMNLLEEYR
jgi:putative two-component system response regulator